MIGTIFIFSDMQFDLATSQYYPYNQSLAGFYGRSAQPAETNFKVAQAEFEKHGFKLPKIVFWNLREDDCAAVPVTHREEGTALVAGFSGQLLKLFMAGADELDKFDPFTIMKEAISADRYNGWKVVD